MIAFDLKCKNEHTFEGWFEDSDNFNDQRKKGLITCPICEDDSITKVPSTFAIKNPPSQQKHSEQKGAGNYKELIALGKAISSYVEKNFEDVGADFTKEALKIHYGVTENRNIRGFSSEQDEKILKEEGIKFFKFPVLHSDSETDV